MYLNIRVIRGVALGRCPCSKVGIVIVLSNSSCVQDNPNIVHLDWCLCLLCDNLLLPLLFSGLLRQAALDFVTHMTRPCSGKVCVAIESYGIQAIQYPQFRAAASKPEGR